ncbi:ABC transporter permease [Conexibacter woesei]|uniref:Binding-protein-dependent transport systems inner membrane component n=1 Tax=Conexibacter woesei (strain DSM 14684 / CCUG 47730 / CIP 108061 / JCM 11494 / NBRC 100937 / ID131577) TaxID=469383 RepID=D3EZ77_CONWI|nr:ABC transporter permease [Conexibacter woesei]ADB51842.1 binding-protein-dependent transport systems inner membrane component [Conexibacter woesei DSM 14684]
MAIDPATPDTTGTGAIRQAGGDFPVAAGPDGEPTAGIGPYRLGFRRLRRNKVALAFGALFLVIVLLCLAAPLYADHVAQTGPNDNHVTEQVDVRGTEKDVVSPAGLPIGPTWQGRFLLGADQNGRDLAVRLLYGGRNSLQVGFVATLITMLLATIIGIVAGFFRGMVDGVLARLLDLIWAYPVVLLGIALGTSLALGGMTIGPISLSGNSLYVPAVIIGIVYIPYVAKPIRGQVLGLREKEFVDAARVQGASSLRIMAREILPNVASTLIVFLPLMVANAILLEAALSYLGAGIQPPNPSWGTMISDGIRLIPSAIHLTFVPGAMLVLCVLGINVFGDGVRDALDPRARVRITEKVRDDPMEVMVEH